ncbi:unnamed protein product [Acanthoscelides obtectus]|uniref:Beta-galactosidase n=1 Tax=Acanthoscelides obtectus TaxID=200917 RepID=A0A9P0L0X1_ACAOB|nr:unnamed protein product [Acanthoscelides obtectus]CAK1632843.1 Beta-galactosidase-1-like protein 2 [Acanthoscelides obtectus]
MLDIRLLKQFTMNMSRALFIFANLFLLAHSLPTLYEYYTKDGIQAGLSDAKPYFTLNNKNITIYSGSFHYFRTPRAYWRDRLRKMRAAGLNTVTTYVPWNLHEPQTGVFDFGNGGSPFQDFLHLDEFLKTAKNEDLFVLVRSGPYINSEWELGGLPSWLAKHCRTVRNSIDAKFLYFVKRYFDVLLPLLAKHQFQKGGPIIAIQVENEYANTGRHDPVYLNTLKQMYDDHGIVEILCTCDRPSEQGRGSIPGILQTANFKVDAKGHLDMLKELQPGKPLMTMEFWTGWFDHWMDPRHHTDSVTRFRTVLEQIMDYPSSVNMYMFVGGTDFRFMNGATMSVRNFSNYLPDTTSYDYDAPISENGALTPKYYAVKEAIAQRNSIKTKLPDIPEARKLVAYPSVKVTNRILISDALLYLGKPLQSEKLLAMEQLPINNNSGQSYGYIAYRKENLDIPAGAKLTIPGYVRDTILVLVNGKLVQKPPKQLSDINGFGFWIQKDSSIVLSDKDLKNATVDLIVENFGRNTLGVFVLKGLMGDVFLNSQALNNWTIIPMEFASSWIPYQVHQQEFVDTSTNSAIHKFKIHIQGDPQDTYLDMREWSKGIVTVNGFVLGRYFFLGPQQALYLPAPLLRNGDNDIVVFEHFKAPEMLKFIDRAVYETPGGLYH